MPGGQSSTFNGVRQYHAEIADLSLSVIQTGIGVTRAKATAREAFKGCRYDLAISSGFACALIPASIGDVVLPNTVVLNLVDSSVQLELPSFPCSVEYQHLFHCLALERGSPIVADVLVTVTKVVGDSSEKQHIAQRVQASALDMESAGIAEVACKNAIPFLVVRTVSDLMDENLPEDFNLFLSPSTWMLGIWRFASRPGHWAHVWRLRHQTQVASCQLTEFFKTFIQRRGQQKMA